MQPKYTWKRLESAEELEKESHATNLDIMNDGSFHYSLRDALNQPHATMVVNRDDIITHIYGRHGAQLPTVDVLDFICKSLEDRDRESVARHQRPYQPIHDTARTGLIKSADGTYHNILRLPDHFQHDGDLNFAYYDGMEKYQCLHITALPANLSVAGDIHLDNCKTLQSIGPGLKARHLFASECHELSHIGDGMQVETAHFTGNKKLKSIPADAQVGVTLNIGDSGIVAVPDHLRCVTEGLPSRRARKGTGEIRHDGIQGGRGRGGKGN